MWSAGSSEDSYQCFQRDEHSGLVNWIFMSFRSYMPAKEVPGGSVACCAALVSVNYTSQVRDRAGRTIIIFGVMLSSIITIYSLLSPLSPSCENGEAVGMVHMTGAVFGVVWRKDS